MRVPNRSRLPRSQLAAALASVFLVQASVSPALLLAATADGAAAQAPLATTAARPVSCEVRACIQSALARHPTLEAARARTAAAEASIRERAAEQRPTITTTAETGYLRGTPTSPFVALGGIDELGQIRRFVAGSFYLGTAALEIPTFKHGAFTLGGSRYINVARITAGARAVEENIVRREIAGTVAEAYFGILKYRDQIPILEKLVGLREADVRMAQAQLERKLVTRSDALVNDVRLATARNDLSRARLAARRTEQAFATAMGLSMMDRVAVSAAAGPIEAPPPVEAIAGRLTDAPTVKAAELNASAKREDVLRIRKDRYPTASIVARYSMADDYRPPIGDEAVVLFRVEWKPFDFGLSSRQVAVALAGEQEEKAKALNERLVLEAELREIYARYEELGEGSSLIAKQLEQATEALQVARAQQTQNLIPLTTLNQAEVGLLELQLARSDNEWERRFTVVQLQILDGAWDGPVNSRPKS
jgi:outer membrane protein TolC